MTRTGGLSTLFMVVFLLVLGGLAQADDAGVPELPQPVEALGLVSGEEPGWGLEDASVLRIHASEFRPQNTPTTTTSFWNTGITYINGSADYYLHAPVILPTGALIVGIGFDGYDVDASQDINWGLRWVTTAADETAGNYGVYVNPTSAGYYSVTATRSPGDLVEPDRYLFFLVDMNKTGQDIRIKGMRVHYKLQISPAPPVPTFADVPTSMWAFQYVEALVASGITQGMPDGLYHPYDPVTRAQMAAFLSRALGLHWPN